MKTHVGITSVLRRYCVGGFAAALLVGCALETSRDNAATFRDEAVTLAATTRFEAARFEGSWSIASRVPTGDPRASVTFDPESETCEFLVNIHDIDEASEFQDKPFCFDAEVAQPGVFNLTRGGRTFPRMVVMWVDETYNTAAVGWEDGQAAYILARGRKWRRDQLAAAREVLAFNGWDVSELRTDE